MDTTSGVARNVILVGPPDAGKSNYLFRAWMALDAAQGVIARHGLPDEVEYLRTGAEALLTGRFAARTPDEVHEHIVIPVRLTNTADERIGAAIIPDVAGEQVRTVYRTRQWSEAWERYITDRTSYLLFLRAGSNRIVPSLDWATAIEQYGGVPPAQPDGVQEEPATPTQVVLVDWLQFIRKAINDRVGRNCVPNLGVVVAAWDAVPADQQEAAPQTYIEMNFPLLHQYLRASGRRFEVEYFGVSVVAGDLKNDEDFRAEYLNGVPMESGYVIHSLDGTLERSSDLTVPLAWALGLRAAEEPRG